MATGACTKNRSVTALNNSSNFLAWSIATRSFVDGSRKVASRASSVSGNLFSKLWSASRLIAATSSQSVVPVSDILCLTLYQLCHLCAHNVGEICKVRQESCKLFNNGLSDTCHTGLSFSGSCRLPCASAASCTSSPNTNSILLVFHV